MFEELASQARWCFIRVGEWISTLFICTLIFEVLAMAKVKVRDVK